MNQKQNTPITFEITDTESGLKGWLAIDSVIDNRCCGGLRMTSCLSADEVKKLAQAMTLKFGFLGIPNGGAKSGIICDEDIEPQDKATLLNAFAKEIKGKVNFCTYNPHPDINTNRQDIFDMLSVSGNRPKRRDVIPERGGWYTGLTAVTCAKVGASILGIDLSGARVAVEGFGKVGAAVSLDLFNMGAKVVAISTSKGALYAPEGLNIPHLISLSRQTGSSVVVCYPKAQMLDKEKILELDLDVLFPCATGHTITMKNAYKIKASLISPGANFPLTDQAQEYLDGKSTLCIPDFISNCGGVLGGTMEFAGFNKRDIVNFVNSAFAKQVRLIIETARKKGLTPTEFAKSIAKKRFERVKLEAEKKGAMSNVFSFGMNLYRRGIIPKWFCRVMAKKYFKQRIEGNM